MSEKIAGISLPTISLYNSGLVQIVQVLRELTMSGFQPLRQTVQKLLGTLRQRSGERISG
jgi:hypothetical protein